MSWVAQKAAEWQSMWGDEGLRASAIQVPLCTGYDGSVHHWAWVCFPEVHEWVAKDEARCVIWQKEEH